jgi:arabinose-5-phosphate isomerase
MNEASLRKVVVAEKDALEALSQAIGPEQLEAATAISQCQGKVIFLGVGKSGHIAEKLAATFASTGTSSFFVHGTEACHGDLGMIEKRDLVVLLSNSGSTKEVVQCLDPIKRIGAKTVAFTSRGDSVLAQRCDYRLLYPALPEADALGLAPTNSSTMALALGDAVACAISEEKHFTRADFHGFHPNGALGAALSKEGK